MKSSLGTSVLVVFSGLSGCAVYDGAIYSSYQQTDISIQSEPQTATPIKLNFGHDQSVISFVPHRDDNESGEAVSVFGWIDTKSITVGDVLDAAATNVAAARAAADAAKKAAGSVDTANSAASENSPDSAGKAAEAANQSKSAAEDAATAADSAESVKTAAEQAAQSSWTGGDLLRTQGRFATGNAASVLVVAQGTNVVIRRPGKEDVPIKVESKPEGRLSLMFPVLSQQTNRELTEGIQECSNMEVVYQDASTRMDACFRKHWDEINPNAPNDQRFALAMQKYLDDNDCPGSREEKRNKGNEAKRLSIESVCTKREEGT